MKVELEYQTPICQKWDRMAVASTIVAATSPVIAVLGLGALHSPLILVFWFGPALLALILGIGSANRINKSRGQLRGIYLAIAGILTALAWALFIVWVLMNVMFD